MTSSLEMEWTYCYRANIVG